MFTIQKLVLFNLLQGNLFKTLHLVYIFHHKSQKKTILYYTNYNFIKKKHMENFIFKINILEIT